MRILEAKQPKFFLAENVLPALEYNNTNGKNCVVPKYLCQEIV